LLLNNSEDVRLSENKVSHECETPKGKVLAIKKKIESFGKKKKTEGQVWRENEWKEERNGEKKKSV
jgi:hypothetical protein